MSETFEELQHRLHIGHVDFDQLAKWYWLQSSEGALKDAVIEAARQYLKLNEHYASVGKTQLRDAIAELDFVSEGRAPDA